MSPICYKCMDCFETNSQAKQFAVKAHVFEIRYCFVSKECKLHKVFIVSNVAKIFMRNVYHFCLFILIDRQDCSISIRENKSNNNRDNDNRCVGHWNTMLVYCCGLSRRLHIYDFYFISNVFLKSLKSYQPIVFDISSIELVIFKICKSEYRNYNCRNVCLVKLFFASYQFLK